MDNRKVAKELVKLAKGITANDDAKEIVNFINKSHGSLKANWTGMWDLFEASRAKVITINRGKGFEKAVFAESSSGNFIYFGPFEIDTMPDKDTLFLFYCDDAFFIKGI
jgi:hypothetical protein